MLGRDPRTGDQVEAVAATSDAEVDAAATRAAEVAPALAAAGLAGRADLLRAMAAELEADGRVITATADRETGLGDARLRSEVSRSAFQFRLFADVLEDGGFLELAIDHADAHAVPAPRPDLRRMLVPAGPVAVFAASNFPLAFSVPGGDTASAIAAGCPVVVKAHPGHARTSQLCAEAMRRTAVAASMPEDVLQVVHGLAAGVRLVRHPAIQAVGFTGSLRAGRILRDLCAARTSPIPFYGELGSINPLIVTPDAAAERADAIAAGLAGSFTLSTGQFCTKPGLAFIPRGEHGETLIRVLAENAAQIPARPMLTASIKDGFLSGAAERAGLPGVRAALPVTGQTAPCVLVAEPDALNEMLVEECFGPLIVVVPYGSEDELSAALARVPGSLTATIHSGAREGEAGSFADRVAGQVTGQAGRVIFNGYPTGVAVTWAQHHGGPYPATTAPHHTSVGPAAIRRFLRPVTYQDAPAGLLPAELREDNPLGLPRRVDGRYETGSMR